jgi:hypothetical protein
MADKMQIDISKCIDFLISNPETGVNDVIDLSKPLDPPFEIKPVLTITQFGQYHTEDAILWKRLNVIFDFIKCIGITSIVLDGCINIDQPKCQQIIAERLPETKITELMIIDGSNRSNICEHTIWFTQQLKTFTTTNFSYFLENECEQAINLIRHMKTNYKIMVYVVPRPSKNKLYHKKISKYNRRNSRARRKCLNAIVAIIALKKRPGNLISRLPKDLIPLITKPIYDTFGTKAWV